MTEICTEKPLFAQCDGSGGASVIALHGLFGMGDNLNRLAQALAGEFCVYRPDLRNHGRSFHADDMTLPALAQDLVDFADRQSLERPYWVGHSLGGKVAMQVALTHPERVRALVVADIAPVRYEAHHDAILEGLQRVDLAAINKRSDADAQLAPHIQSPPVRQFLLKSLYRDDAGAFRWRFNLPALAAGYENILQAVEGAACPCPALFIRGEQSDYVLPAYETRIRELFPNAQIETLAGTGHWLHAEQPQAFNQLVKEFLHSAAD